MTWDNAKVSPPWTSVEVTEAGQLMLVGESGTFNGEGSVGASLHRELINGLGPDVFWDEQGMADWTPSFPHYEALKAGPQVEPDQTHPGALLFPTVDSAQEFIATALKRVGRALKSLEAFGYSPGGGILEPLDAALGEWGRSEPNPQYAREKALDALTLMGAVLAHDGDWKWTVGTTAEPWPSLRSTRNPAEVEDLTIVLTNCWGSSGTLAEEFGEHVDPSPDGWM